MKHRTSDKTVRVVDHSIPLSNRDLARLLSANTEHKITPREIDVAIVVNRRQASVDEEPLIFSLDDVLEFAREMNEDIPDEADIQPAIRWREESAASQALQPHVAQQPSLPPLPPPAAGSGSWAAPLPPSHPSVPTCNTCGGQPDLQGPTPDCSDPVGCGRVRATRGDLPIPTSHTVEDRLAAGRPAGGPGKPTGKLVNRETGKEAFAAVDGVTPYGVHDDYDRTPGVGT